MTDLPTSKNFIWTLPGEETTDKSVSNQEIILTILQCIRNL